MDSFKVITKMAEEEELPSNRFPEFAMLCHKCQHEFKLETSFEEIENAQCPACQSQDVESLYVAFPDDGPGFRKNFNEFKNGGCD
ncbi:hypothetical protein AAC978_12575 [Desulfitobacterium sp. THU1]|uniref:hypothetical protein n=1 Tax=Desulfitobacterium sp. THU1 TaxID=3138072 RepID=UPI0031204E40